ncbi:MULTISPECIES: PepSY domain-containing protein [Coprobacillaceae]|uniref:PepSY domain-containing protein n=1 Tax=Coprobacillaceae TaxID=2810280 RepID=UPI000E4DDE64|nr:MULTISPECIES: PepSY domain-containing protein [Coprobacillaceae]RHM59764.1 hypothetical protein DWZ53_08685 [Coprobacillus sp. AF33-1AC]RHS96082.1 hypothetical protein DW911_01750 [Erysipelatoclostridium sp. AM42-17]
MKAFLKKHRFKIVFILLAIIFIYVCFYMLWIHVPYATKQNEMTSIRNEICQEHHYQYKNVFYEYNSDQTYYILKVKKKKVKYVVYDEKLKYVESFDKKIISKNQIKASFNQKYQQNPQRIELGYENGMLVYVATYRQDNVLIYAYYSANNGEFIKAYKL